MAIRLLPQWMGLATRSDLAAAGYDHERGQHSFRSHSVRLQLCDVCACPRLLRYPHLRVHSHFGSRWSGSPMTGVGRTLDLRMALSRSSRGGPSSGRPEQRMSSRLGCISFGIPFANPAYAVSVVICTAQLFPLDSALLAEYMAIAPIFAAPMRVLRPGIASGSGAIGSRHAPHDLRRLAWAFRPMLRLRPCSASGGGRDAGGSVPRAADARLASPHCDSTLWGAAAAHPNPHADILRMLAAASPFAVASTRHSPQKGKEGSLPLLRRWCARACRCRSSSAAHSHVASGSSRWEATTPAIIYSVPWSLKSSSGAGDSRHTSRFVARYVVTSLTCTSLVPLLVGIVQCATLSCVPRIGGEWRNLGLRPQC